MALLETVGRAPKELQGYTQTVTNGSPLPPPTQQNGQNLMVPFSVEGLTGPITLPSIPNDEVTPLVRVWIDFSNCSVARLQGRVAVAGNSGDKFGAKYTTDGGTTWNWLGVDANGGNGPVLMLDATGDIRGDEVTLDSAVAYSSDTLVGLFLLNP